MTKPASIFDAAIEEEQPVVPRPSQDEVRAVAQGTSFRSREALPVAPVAPVAPVKPAPYRYRTGRDAQFNVKVKRETRDKFEHWAELLRRPKGELLERAAALLEADLQAELDRARAGQG